MRYPKKTLRSRQDSASSGQVIPMVSGISDQIRPKKAPPINSETDVPRLLSSILDEISRFESQSFNFRVFEPLEPDHLLSVLVSRLGELDPSSFGPGSRGKSLWRKVVRSSVLPSEADYLSIFDNLEAFEFWLVENYHLGSTDPLLTIAEKRPIPDLSRTEYEVVQATTNEPQRGNIIAKRAGYNYDTVRRILPRLVECGYLQKTKRGYIRQCSQGEHNPVTSPPQTN